MRTGLSRLNPFATGRPNGGSRRNFAAGGRIREGLDSTQPSRVPGKFGTVSFDPNAVHRGQREAALAIGMRNALAMRSIILPQALRIIVPPMANYAVSLLKDTSVASLIPAPEPVLRARELSSESFMPMELYLLVGAMYLVMAYPLGKGAQYLEARMGKGRVAG